MSDEKQMIEVSVGLEIHDIKIDQAIEELKKLSSQHPEGKVHMYGDSVVELVYTRLETDEEFEKRKKNKRQSLVTNYLYSMEHLVFWTKKSKEYGEKAGEITEEDKENIRKDYPRYAELLDLI